MKRTRRTAIALAAVILALAACTGAQMTGEAITRALRGVPATMYTYAFDGSPLDRVQGESFRLSRDEAFDQKSGESVRLGSVILVSLGNSHISHVGSTMILEQRGIERLTDAETRIDITSTEAGRPWLNDLVYRWRQGTTGGKSRVILVRSQSSVPIAVYAGNQVEIVGTDIPNSTWMRVDGRYLFVYRAEFTIYDANLLTP